MVLIMYTYVLYTTSSCNFIDGLDMHVNDNNDNDDNNNNNNNNSNDNDSNDNNIKQ